MTIDGARGCHPRIQVGRDRVARLMRVAGTRRARRHKHAVTTVSAPVQRDLSDLVKPRWDSGEPDRVWVADLTYVPSSEGTVYTSFVQDGGSKRILGFTVASNMNTGIVTTALEQAVATRRRGAAGFTPCGLIFHSDSGSQYGSLALSTRLHDLGIAPSVGRTGTALDNAAMETTYRSLQDGADPNQTLGFMAADRDRHQRLGEVVQRKETALHPRLPEPQQLQEALPSTTEPAKAARVRPESLQDPEQFKLGQACSRAPLRRLNASPLRRTLWSP